ncbi:MAG TPA: ABC transporter permease subunit [Clostridiales bacterium]|nr:ABC transporter permease subunit [Clostridiales bacterium]
MTSITSHKRKIQGLLILGFWLAVWQIAAALIDQDLILASPVQVVQNLAALIDESSFWSAITYSFVRIISGFLLAIMVGILLAIISGRSKVIHALLSPLFVTIKSVPVVSFIILVLIWSGSAYLSVVISFLMVLPIIYLNVVEGIVQTDQQLLEMAKVFRVSWFRQIKAIYTPGVLPYFLSASKIALGLCWKSGVAAEVIGLSSGSIGEKMYQAKISLDTAELLSWTLVIITISYFFERIFITLLKQIERKLAGEAQS